MGNPVVRPALLTDRRGHCVECPPCLETHPFPEHCPRHEALLAGASPAADTRARPIVYASESEGQMLDIMAYTPDGEVILDWDTLPVRVIAIDWDIVTRSEEPDEEYECQNVRELIADETLPQSLRDDLRLSYEHARRFDDLDDDD